jgi:hypothetical protein
MSSERMPATVAVATTDYVKQMWLPTGIELLTRINLN